VATVRIESYPDSPHIENPESDCALTFGLTFEPGSTMMANRAGCIHPASPGGNKWHSPDRQKSVGEQSVPSAWTGIKSAKSAKRAEDNKDGSGTRTTPETQTPLLLQTSLMQGVRDLRGRLQVIEVAMTKLPVAEIERADAHADNPKSKHCKTAVPDRLVPDSIAKAELGGVSNMTWWRWQRDAHMAELGFPVAIVLRARTYRSRAELEAFKARLMREAITARSQPQRRGPKTRERT
jgi:hypothetical protein